MVDIDAAVFGRGLGRVVTRGALAPNLTLTWETRNDEEVQDSMQLAGPFTPTLPSCPSWASLTGHRQLQPDARIYFRNKSWDGQPSVSASR